MARKRHERRARQWDKRHAEAGDGSREQAEKRLAADGR